MCMGDGGLLCMEIGSKGHNGVKRYLEGEISMKMTKKEAENIAKKCVEYGKKTGIPMKKKKK